MEPFRDECASLPSESPGMNGRCEGARPRGRIDEHLALSLEAHSELQAGLSDHEAVELRLETVSPSCQFHVVFLSGRLFALRRLVVMRLTPG
eukprot:6463312-Pyramimonas_sp.AAC.1